MVFSSPGKFLGVPIKVTGENGMKEGSFGQFKVPFSYPVSVMDIFSSHSWGLLDYCAEIDRGRPNFLYFCRRLACAVLMMDGSCYLVRTVKFWTRMI